MDWSGLRNFFQMHGENVDRLAGKPGRGRFGTGKSAAFGIAGEFEIRTVRDGKRSIVRLTRSDIESMGDDSPIPVQTLEREKTTSEPNGTQVTITDVKVRRLDQKRVIGYIERHLARWRRDVTVWVNNHECQFVEPAAVRTLTHRPEGKQAEVLGDSKLVLKVAAGPVDEELRGVGIYSSGVWHESTYAGSEGREMVNHIFGEIDVPALDAEDSPITPFDVSRSMQLNPNNATVQAIYAFVGRHVEDLRKQLVSEEKKRRASDEARRLEVTVRVWRPSGGARA
jgi:hypothetical protein